MLNRALGKEKVPPGATEWAAAVLARLEELAAERGELLLVMRQLEGRLRALEAAVAGPDERSLAGRLAGLAGEVQAGQADTLARLDALRSATRLPEPGGKRRGRALAEVIANLENHVASLADQLARQRDQLGRHQGALASLPDALEQLGRRVAALERQQQEGNGLLHDLAAAQRESRDQVELLLAQHQERLSGADALALLARLLGSPQEAPPLFRHGEAICFRPKVPEEWLLHQGLSRAEVAGVRRVWRDARLVPSEATDNFNKRLRVAGGRQAYVMAVPTRTYADLRVPVPRGLPAEPPS